MAGGLAERGHVGEVAPSSSSAQQYEQLNALVICLFNEVLPVKI
jgi:hypothetical protein